MSDLKSFQYRPHLFFPRMWSVTLLQECSFFSRGLHCCLLLSAALPAQDKHCTPLHCLVARGAPHERSTMSCQGQAQQRDVLLPKEREYFRTEPPSLASLLSFHPKFNVPQRGCSQLQLLTHKRGQQTTEVFVVSREDFRDVSTLILPEEQSRR